MNETARGQSMESLCESCAHVREVVSGSGSRFLLCRLSHQDRRYRKYPPQPVVQCRGFEATRKGPLDQ